jgi:hypothetical protein
MPAKDQWANWKDHPCTQAMMKELRDTRENGILEVGYGAEDDNLLLLGVKLGKINALTVILDYGFIPQED